METSMYHNSESKPPSLDYILKRTSDVGKMNLTTKQYYSRISGLTDAGLIKRYKGKYSLTSLGKVVDDSQTIISKALTYYWRLRTIDSIETSYGAAHSNEELDQLIDALIENHHIKDIIMKPISVGSAKEDTNMHQLGKIPIIISRFSHQLRSEIQVLYRNTIKKLALQY
jgi:hypothetical protein